jgi:hypothetical protein
MASLSGNTDFVAIDHFGIGKVWRRIFECVLQQVWAFILMPDFGMTAYSSSVMALPEA